MNEHTEAVLDYTLIRRELQAYTVTPMGQALAAQLHPCVDEALCLEQMRETSELATLLAMQEAPPLSTVIDVTPFLATAHIEGFYLEGSQLLEVASCLEVLQRLRRYGQGEVRQAPLLSRRLARLPDFGILLRQLRHALDEQGQVRDHASPVLAHARQTLRRLRESIQTKLRMLLHTHSAVVQDAIVTIRNNRFVVPLKTDFRQTLRGIVHGESASGATVYVEPDSVVDLNNQVLHAQAEEERAVREVLRELTAHLAVQRVPLEQALRLLGEVDFAAAKGRLSVRMRGVAPSFTAEPHLRLLQARHPLLSAPVPVDVHLGPEATTLVITGPNTGGKTAILKTVGLLILMAQSGLHIPASSESLVPMMRAVYVDLGDEQSLQQNLSTFSAHLTNICGMLAEASTQTLILLDELGAGTDPLEGGPLGIALLDYFQQCGAMTLVTTHHGAIKAFAMSAPRTACAAVDFDAQTLAPRYQLIYGLPGRSQAFVIAQKLGVPAAVLARAEQEAGLTHVRNEQLLARLETQRAALEAERLQLQEERADTARLHSEAQQIVLRAQAEEQRVRQLLYTEGQQLLKQARQELDTTLAALRGREPSPMLAFPQEEWQRAVQTVAALQPAAPEAPPASPRPFQVGDVVRVRGLNVVGRLRTPVEGGGAVQVESSGKTLTVMPADLERSDTAYHERPWSNPPARRPRRQAAPARETVPSELRVLGYTVAEAIPAVEKYLDQAAVQGVSRLRIVHGVGSGRLREAIADLLRSHPLVHRFQSGDAGGGITIVELEG